MQQLYVAVCVCLFYFAGWKWGKFVGFVAFDTLLTYAGKKRETWWKDNNTSTACFPIWQGMKLFIFLVNCFFGGSGCWWGSVNITLLELYFNFQIEAHISTNHNLMICISDVLGSLIKFYYDEVFCPEFHLFAFV